MWWLGTKKAGFPARVERKKVRDTVQEKSAPCMGGGATELRRGDAADEKGAFDARKEGEPLRTSQEGKEERGKQCQLQGKKRSAYQYKKIMFSKGNLTSSQAFFWGEKKGGDHLVLEGRKKGVRATKREPSLRKWQRKREACMVGRAPSSFL